MIITEDFIFRLDRRLAKIEAAMLKPEQVTYSMLEATKYLHVSQTTARAWIKSGRLQGNRKGTSHHIFTRAQLDSALAWTPEIITPTPQENTHAI